MRGEGAVAVTESEDGGGERVRNSNSKRVMKRGARAACDDLSCAVCAGVTCGTAFDCNEETTAGPKAVTAGALGTLATETDDAGAGATDFFAHLRRLLELIGEETAGGEDEDCDGETGGATGDDKDKDVTG